MVLPNEKELEKVEVFFCGSVMEIRKGSLFKGLGKKVLFMQTLSKGWPRIRLPLII